MRVRHSRLNYRKEISLLFALFLCCTVFSQSSSITILDQNSEPLIGVQMYVNAKPYSSSDHSGQIELTGDFVGTDIIRLEYLSYTTVETTYAEIKNQGLTVAMSPAKTVMDEIVVIGRYEQIKEGKILPVEIIDAKQIEQLQVQSPADLLEKNGSVFIQKSQMGGGSPVVRGFEANKVLLVLDGVRMNNAIYRSGHLQNAITVDEMVMEKAEVLFGPGSIIYGSDAIGGVVHFRTRTPKLSEKFKIKPALFSRLASANREKTVHGNVELSSRSWSAIFGLTASDFGDLRAGKKYPEKYPDFGKRSDYVSIQNGVDAIVENQDPELQIGTGFKQQDYFAKLRYAHSEELDFTLNTQYSTSGDIPRYDRLSEREGNGLRFAEWYYGPQNRLLVALTTKVKKENKLFDELYFINAIQRIDEDRISRDFGATEKEENFEDVTVSSSSIDLIKTLSPSLDIRYGGEFQHNNIVSTSSTGIFTRYPNGKNTMSLFGSYIKSGYKINKELDFNLGLRYSYAESNIQFVEDNFFVWPEYFYDGIKNTNSNISFLSSLSYTQENYSIYVNGGSAFRAPNIDDLAKIRVMVDEITVPNPELAPEKSWNAELGLSVGTTAKNLRINAFYTSLNNAIVRRPFMLVDGSENYTLGEDSYFVVANVNEDKARVYGLSANTKILFTQDLTFNASVTWIRGRTIEEQEESQPLSHIPPLYGKMTLSHVYKSLEHFLAFSFNGKKDISDFGGSVDNPDLATLEGSLAWNTLNYYMTYKINTQLKMSFAIENIMDVHYRTFSSGVSAPGRNFIASFKYTL